MGNLLSSVVSIFLWFLILLTVYFSTYSEGFEVQCIASEQEALLKFKQHLKDPTNRLHSWNESEDCCKWAGVFCSNLTGHVVELHLRTSQRYWSMFDYSYQQLDDYDERSIFSGEMSSSLLDLSHMSYIDLSGNDFGGIQIPYFIGSIIHLTHLNLSHSNFGGMIPHQIGNLSNLCYLNLHGNYLYAKNVQWLLPLSSLQYLDLSYVNLSVASDLPQVLEKLPSLMELHLSSCHLNIAFEPLSTNISSLVILDLSDNYYEQPSLIPQWIFRQRKLVALNLRGNDFQGPILNGIQNLTYLENLDLSYNRLNSSISLWLSSFTHLVSLNLRGNDFQGLILDGIQNLTYLENLDLSYNRFNSSISLWLSTFTHVVSLNLRQNHFQGPILDGIQNLTYLEYLDLSSNLFNSTIPMWLSSFTHLKFLILFENNLCGTISNVIPNLTSLVILDLSYNQFEGKIPRSFGNLCNMKEVYFSNLINNQEASEILEIFSACISQKLEIFSLFDSKLSGHLTDQIGTFRNLVMLDLRNNSLQGELPESLGTLQSLNFLYLRTNQFIGNPFDVLKSLARLQFLNIIENLFQGVVTEDHLANFTRLETLFAGRNQLSLKVSPKWSPSFQLEALDLNSWQLGPDFPSWIQSQKNLVMLSLPNTSISDSIPISFWSSLEYCFELDLSHNEIHGQLPNNPKNLITTSIDLSSNRLSGKLPYISPRIAYIDLSNNLFSGTITDFLCHQQFQHNKLQSLNLASNNLSGKIPDCWLGWESLKFIKLESNNFTGRIPNSLDYLAYLEVLVLRRNKLSGKLPNSLSNCTRLFCLDIGENKLSGIIPRWVGKRLLGLGILSLQSNRFIGQIPSSICALSSLQVLDASHNDLSGAIPKCLHRLSLMSGVINIVVPSIYYQFQIYYNMVSLFVVANKKLVEYNKTARLLTVIDLSNNKLSGDIPKEITSLRELLFLNLSNNILTGQIPESLGSMRSLLLIDFSKNQLCGEIPQSITNLSFLNNLDLSFNHFKGEIPKGTQLQSFEASSFIGNELCGPPLPTSCTPSSSTHGVNQTDKAKGHGIHWFYVSMALGFIVGFWGVVGPLFISRSWRFAYYCFLDRMWYKLQDCCI